MRLILASASPRRRELLAQAGYAFEVRPADVNEDPRAGEDPIAYVTRLAREKASAAYAAMAQGTRERGNEGPREQGNQGTRGRGDEGTRDQGTGDGDLVVLGADTTVVVDGEMLAKPLDAADARRMLRMLSGRTHRVITGVAVVSEARTRGRTADPSTPLTADAANSAQDDSGIFENQISVEVAAEVTAVTFLTLSDAEIDAYIATGEPMDKAGAYAIQGRAARWIPRVEGCYFNVVGLPLALVGTMLEGAGNRE